jgi:hypothetical protein
MGNVLILSNRDEDAHIPRLTAEIDKLGHFWALVDPGDFPDQASFSAWIGDDARQSFICAADGKRLILEDITSVWYRRPTPIAARKDVSSLEKTFIEREANAGLWGWLRGLRAFWVNHPDAIRAAGHKPQQLQLAQSLGLAVPRTLITFEYLPLCWRWL